MAKSRKRGGDRNPSEDENPGLADSGESLDQGGAGDWMQALADVARATSSDRGEVRQHVREKAERLTKALRRLDDDGEEIVDALERNIREQPVMVLLGAFGVGVLLGRVIRGE